MPNWVKSFLESNPELEEKIHSRGRYHLAIKDQRRVVYNFVGSPCHYLDGEIWKPIDTTLVDMGGGEFGSPFSRARFNPDGSVKLLDEKKSPVHLQKSVRVGLFNSTDKSVSLVGTLPDGEVVDDSIVRSYDKFTHKLTLTESGFREYLILNSPVSIPVDRWIVIETEIADQQLFPDGWVDDALIGGLRFPAPHGWDGNNKPLPIKRFARFTGDKQYLYTGIQGASLAGAAYPITIDPDYPGDAADGYIYGLNAAYATARSTSYSFLITQNLAAVGQSFQSSNYYVNRGFLKFDTSAIPDWANITQVNLKMVCVGDYSTVDFDVQIVKQNWVSQDPITDGNREDAYDNCLSGTADSNIWQNTSGMSPNTQYASGNLDTTWVNKTGFTYYSLRSSRDLNNDTPSGTEVIDLASQDHATEAYRPILTVELLGVAQHSFRVFNDDGNEAASTPKAALNTNVTAPAGTTLRPRFLIDATGDPDAKQFQVEVRKTSPSVGPWYPILP
jgi:hypothetical protein